MPLSNLRIDVAHAWRGLRVSPGLTIAALVTLALGVGANTAVFSVTHALLVEPLPFRDPSRLVFVWADQTSEGYPRAPLSGPELQDLDQRNTRFDGFAAIWATTAAFTGGTDPEQLRIGLVTTDFFSLLGADAAHGRTFDETDDVAGPPTGVLLSAAVWQRRFGSDPGIVGRRIDVNGQPVTVIGVMPIGFRLMMPPDAAVPDDLEAWLPFNRRFTEGPRGQRYLRVVGRLRSGVSVDEGREDLARVGREISQAHAFYGATGRQFETVPLHLDATRDVRTPLVVLSVGAGILLLMACVNVASLLVARAAGRARETAMKAALGAGLGRIVRQHLFESLLLAAIGGVAGLLLGRWGLSLLLAVTPEALDRLRLATVSATVVAVSLGTVVAWTMVLAAAPLSEALRLNLVEALRNDGQRAGRPGLRLRRLLTVMQLALSVILVVAALLLVRTVERIHNVDPGFRAVDALTFRIAPPGSRYATQDAFNAFGRELQVALAALPGVTGASAISHVPYDHVPNWGGPYLADPGGDPSAASQADYRAVAPGMMELLQVRLVEGRTFTESDDHHGAPVVIVDERLAARTWPGESPIGRRLGVDPWVTGTPSTWVTVVGLVQHVRHRSPTEDVREQVYFPARQVPRNPFAMIVKTAGDPAALTGAVRDAVARLDAALPIYDVRPLAVYIERARAIRRFTALLAAVFALAAVLLASVGIYGVIAYSVSARRREFGVRLALGARSTQIAGVVMRESTWLTATGLLVGIVVSVAGAWWARSQLFEVVPWDIPSLGATVLILGLVAGLASAMPIRRALGTNPADVLRAD